jgi:hypothetical protein
MPFEPGQRVRRIEDREITGATVLSVESGPDGRTYHIAYDEGGEGYWPETSLAAEED